MTRILNLFSVLALLSGCVSSAPQHAPTATTAPRLPGKVVWTDGHSAIAASLPGKAACAPLSAADVAQALSQTNATRARAGLPPLSADARLMRAAEVQACDMAGRGQMTHKGSSTSGPMARARAAGYAPRKIAENIAAGRFTLGSVVEQWAASPAHRANVMLQGARGFGIGRAVAADGKTTFWASVYAN